MPLKILFLRPQNWSRLKPYYQSTITAVKDAKVPRWGYGMAGGMALGEAFLPTVGAFLLTVKLLCLQSLRAVTRRTLPL